MNKLQEIELQELEQQDEQERQAWAITDINGLDWAMRKLNALQSKITENKQLAEAQIERYKQWEREVNGKHEQDIAFFEHKIKEYHAQVLAMDPKAKSIKTPHGIVKSKTYEAVPVLKDDDALLAFLDSDAERQALIKVEVKKSVAWAEFKKQLTVVEDGEDSGLIVITSDGEIVPGVSVEPAKTTFKVEVSD